MDEEGRGNAQRKKLTNIDSGEREESNRECSLLGFSLRRATVSLARSDSLELLLLYDSKITSVEFDGWATPKLRELWLSNNLLTSIPAFRCDSLELLFLYDNKITSVEFDGWATPKLRELYLYNNLLTSVPAFKSDSLEILNLRDNKITSVEFHGWATTKLRDFAIARNPLSGLPSAAIKGMKNLETFHCYESNLGPTLLRGVLEFQSKALKLVTLWGNNISEVEEGAITGLGPNTEIFLTNNEIVVLSEESFRPMLDILSKGYGVLNLTGNPIRCDCDIAWLVLNEKFLTSISGKCHNGTELKDLDVFAMKDCGRQSNVSASTTQAVDRELGQLRLSLHNL
ncbi:unnamed protein product [Darwinula stevensoni]|uniref:Uncharacterized protein n=1 Tax=Darwinula stevensoni TaxID=69355 RepID=A0A7R9AC77_9CRUS|nr:unnamed protein product [Darwinula stevensoni]CAG0899919.1 unnamed protein product [Darwinula stevensoni]